MEDDYTPIDSPCEESIEPLGPDETRRFCEACQKDVHNLSAMTRQEADAFLAEHDDEDVCVTFSTRGDGKLRFRDEESTGRAQVQSQRRGLRRLLGAAALATPLALGAACDTAPPSDNPESVQEASANPARAEARVSAQPESEAGDRVADEGEETEMASNPESGAPGGGVAPSTRPASADDLADESCTAQTAPPERRHVEDRKPIKIESIADLERETMRLAEKRAGHEVGIEGSDVTDFLTRTENDVIHRGRMKRTDDKPEPKPDIEVVERHD